ncbi:DUF1697 domain-containing protein [Allosalinactinospora lopnorensis]|uniref:DUF1697 domain-containing protein n=1 Tax=Allosalinactinospora lopnorensis TaxID=1352348 RepID=UPI000B1F9FC8|nr:DUF1697 domain-containing protein [Allosalinactinospora lopnorensis]
MRYVALLSGVNLGKHRRIAMAELRGLLAGLGYTEARTHLQSGNAVFSAPERPSEQIAAEIEDRIAREAGFEVGVVVRTAGQLRAVVESVPLDIRDPARFLVLFLAEPPDPERLVAIDAESFAPEEMGVGERELYLFLPDGVRNARLPAILQKHMPGPATARNWSTVTRLLELAEG